MKKNVLSELLPALSLVLDYQEQGNLYHAWRVAIISYQLAKANDCLVPAAIFYTALLHDIGIFGTGEHILKYRDLSSQKASPAIFNHPVIGADIVKGIPGLFKAEDYILQHHEYYDGSGYPYGMRGEEILVESQIIRMADTIDILLRSPRAKPSVEEVASYVKSEELRQFSPAVCNLFLRAYDKTGKSELSAIYEDMDIAVSFDNLVYRLSPPQAYYEKDPTEIILKIFSRIIDNKHHYTSRHSIRTALYSENICRQLGLLEEDTKNIKFAAYLHDLGKIAVPNSIIDKPGPLTDEEWEIIKTHAPISYDIVNSVASLKALALFVAASQERWDGKGYPSGLKAEDIPLASRIIAVADAIDAMLSDRAYRKALILEKAEEELRKNSGTQFDPQVVQAALEILKKDPGLPGSLKEKSQKTAEKSYLR